MTPTEKLKQLSEYYKCWYLTQYVLGHHRFPLWSAASKPGTHHYGKGGLAQHTLEVAELCLMNNVYFAKDGRGVDTVQLFVAAVFHDFGKIDDYEPVGRETSDGDFVHDHENWKATDHKYKIHHVNKSAMAFNEVCNIQMVNPEWRDEVVHAILAHHGRPEWGSPVEPQSRLAWILHLSDHMSARMFDCENGKHK